MLLTNNRNSLALYDWLARHEIVHVYSEKVNAEMLARLRPSVVVSYNYNHIIPAEVIAALPYAIVNLHVSMLPYNRGSSPNFWSFIDDTPKGVTIHEIVTGLDKGNIIAQKELHFDEKSETFASTYQKLNLAIQELFKQRWPDIRQHSYVSRPQQGVGTYHNMQDLHEYLQGEELDWSENIRQFKERHR